MIRQAIIAALTPIGLAVHAGRVHPESVEGLPVLNVVTGDEEVLEDEAGQVPIEPAPGKWRQLRSCEFHVELRVASAPFAGPDDQLDTLALSVEQALNADPSLGGAATFLDYRGTAATESTGELEEPVGLRTLNYVAEYRVDARDPQALED